MEIVIEENQIGDSLGRQGSSGFVVSYKNNKALKIMTVSKVELEKKLNEVQNGSNHNHPHILSYDGYFVKKEQFLPQATIFIEMPRMKETLEDCMERRFGQSEKFSNEEMVKYSYGLMSGLAYLHQKGIAHRDIKPQNLLFDKEFILKIGDHGISKKIQSDFSTSRDTQNRPCTKYYASPELYDLISGPLGQEPTRVNWEKVDSWSAGLVVLSLVQKKITFLPEGPYNNEKKMMLKGILDSLETVCEAPLARAIRELLAIDPQARKLPKDILQLLEDSYPTIIQDYKQKASLLVARSVVPNIQGSQNLQANQNLIEEAKMDHSISLDEIKKKWQDLMSFSHHGDSVTLSWTDVKSLKDKYLKEVTNDIVNYFTTRDPSSIKTLNVHIFRGKEITKEALGEHFNLLAGTFAGLETLNGLVRSSFQEENLTFITPVVFRPFTTLKNFRLNCCSEVCFNVPQLQNWVNAINQNLTSLETFEFQHAHSLDLGVITTLVSLKLPNLKVLRLQSHISSITDKEIIDFANSFAASQDLQKLQTFCLKLSACYQGLTSFESKREVRDKLKFIPNFDMNIP